MNLWASMAQKPQNAENPRSEARFDHGGCYSLTDM